MEGKASISARKAQKADREKLRRERLNEQFLELGNTVEPDRPKNDKVTMLVDTTQMLNDLTAEVNRLKAECSSLTEESCELTQEKKELREENAYLQGDITNLKIQYQQRLRFMFPWTGIDPSVVVAPPYLYPVPLSVPMGPVARRPSLQPYPFFGNHNAGVVDNPCSTFISYSTTAHPPMERALSSDVSFQRDCGSKSMDDERGSVGDKCDGSNDVVTELELKIPGSSTNQDLEAGEKKGKQTDKKERSLVNHLSSRQYNSSQGSQDNASNIIDEISKCSK